MIRNTKLWLASYVYTSTIVAMFVSEARAQHPVADEPTAQLDEIVITATKRESTVQATPISVTAVTGLEIQERGIADFTSLAQTIPGVSMKTGGPGQTEFEMRGLSAGGGNSPTVGFYLDDTPLTAPAGSYTGRVVIDPNLYDLNRVEVLRGPQGTLYGASSMGGTIKLVPNSPNTKNFDTSVQTIFSDTDGGGFNYAENGMVNLPFGNGNAALRIVGTAAHTSGWIDRIVIAEPYFPLETNGNTTRGNVLAAPVAATYHHVNDEDLTGVRASILWTPTDRLTITPSVFYQRITQDGLNDIDNPPQTNAHYEVFNSPEPFADKFTLGSVNVQYRFDSFDLNSTTSKWTRDEDIREDGSEEFQWALSTPTSLFPFYTSQGGIGAESPTPLETDQSDQITEEIRLASSGTSPFNWLVGYFYSDFTSTTDLYNLAPGAASVLGSSNLYTQIQPTKIIQNSFFGEISYQLTQQLKATLGARRYAYDSSLTTLLSGVFTISASDAVTASSKSQHDQGVDPKFDLSYAFDKDLLVYATVAKGFRPGGATAIVPTSGINGTVCELDLQQNHGTTSFVPAPYGYAPDSLWSYELGEKASFLDNRITVNGAAYFEKWTGVQQTISLACGYVFTDNAGDAHVYGSELEVNGVLVPGLVLSANAGYTHATFVKPNLESGTTAGTRVQDVPDWTSTVALAYRRNISDHLRLLSRVEYNYVGTRTDLSLGLNRLPSYDLASARVGFEGDRWSAIVFGSNLFNKRAFLSDSEQINIATSTFNRIAVNQPLTIGIDLSYHFGR
jgi:iron complex outermembrane receptor protein